MRIVILGAGYAGVNCAVRLARKSRGRPVQITLVNASDRLVERIRLHEQAAGRRPPEHDLRGILRGTGVVLTVGHATAIDLEAQALIVDEQPVPWDRLVLALGSRTNVDGVPGIREHAFTLDSASTARLAAQVPAVAARGGRVVVVGGGLTGIEAATELAERHPSLRVSLVTRGRIVEGWSEAARAHLLHTFDRLGIELRECVAVESIDAGRLQTCHGPVRFDLCVWSVGFSVPSLPREAGVAVNERGQVLLDPMLRSLSHPHVYAAGDVAWPVDAPGGPLPMGCKSAGPTGAHVADNLVHALAGEPEQPLHYVAPLYCVSLGRHDALVQTTVSGAPTGRVLTGRPAAWIKELICRATVWMLHLQRRGLMPAMQAGSGRVPAIASTSTSTRRLAA
jgi:NADH dehydrogenase